MDLNPQNSLADLEAAYYSYLSGAPEQHRELAVTLQRAINRGEIEVGNLSMDAATDFEKCPLWKQLMCTIEMAKVAMPQA